MTAAAALPVLLSEDERALVDLLAQGLTAAAIARSLYVSERTLQKRVQALMAKVGARNATQLVAATLRPAQPARPAGQPPADLIAARRLALLNDLDRHQAERGTPYRPGGRAVSGPVRQRRMPGGRRAAA